MVDGTEKTKRIDERRILGISGDSVEKPVAQGTHRPLRTESEKTLTLGDQSAGETRHASITSQRQVLILPIRLIVGRLGDLSMRLLKKRDESD